MSDLWERTWLESGIEAAWRDFELRYGSGAAAAAAAPVATRRISQAGAEPSKDNLQEPMVRNKYSSRGLTSAYAECSGSQPSLFIDPTVLARLAGGWNAG